MKKRIKIRSGFLFLQRQTILKYLFLLFLAFSFNQTRAQMFYRVQADFMIKSKSLTGEQQLTVGKVYYDKNIKQIVYEINFPEKEIWIQRDTVLFKIIDSKVIMRQSIPTMVEFSVFHLVLNGNLTDFGLTRTKFRIKKVEKVDGNIISTWEPPSELKELSGDILLSNIDQQLNGIVFKSSLGEVISKQFFRNYTKVNGLSFPQEIIKEDNVGGQKVYEVTTFSKILINDLSGENNYNYKIPSN